jgi:DNA polymerase elongation subunit (family B)
MNNDILFQIIDWTHSHESLTVEDDSETSLEKELGCEPEEKLEYKIRLFGRTNENKSIFINVDNFTPFFYIEIPTTWTKTKAFLLISYLKKKIGNKKTTDGLKDFSIVDRKKFKGFTDYKDFKFIRLVFSNLISFKAFERWIDKNRIQDPTLYPKPTKLTIYESNIDPFIRCMHIQKLNSCGWVKVSEYTDYKDPMSYCEINIRTDWNNLIPHENSSIQKFIIASFDIECMSESGNFPEAKNDSDPIIQIGTVFSYYGESEPFYKHMITLNGCTKTNALQDVDLECYKTEKKALLAWTKLIQRIDPDVITGYNINGFDFEYIKDRAKKFGILKEFSKLSRIIGEDTPWKEKALSSSAMGDNLLKYFDMNGRIIIDLMKVLQRDAKLDSYKLDSVSSYYIKETIKSTEIINKKTIITTTSIYGIKEDQYVSIMYNDGLTDNKHDEKYKILKIDSVNKKITINGIIPDEVFENNNKVYWCHAKDDITPNELFKLYKGSDDDRAIIAKYCIQDCVLVTKLLEKLQVLNNNIGMANVCNVPLNWIFTSGQGKKIFSLVSKKCRELNHLVPKLIVKNNNNNNDNYKFHKIKYSGSEDSEDEKNVGYEGATVFEPDKGVHYEPIPVLDYASLYPRSMIYKNISHECIVLDKKYDDIQGYTYHTVSYKNNDGTTSTCRYAKKNDGQIGILPLILIELLDKRSATKKLMDNEEDKFKKNIYDGLQLAYKVTANSLYGQLGAPTSPIYFKELAASTTATGREMLEYSRDFIQGPYGNIINLAISDKVKYNEKANELFKDALDKKFINSKAGYNNKQEYIDYFYTKINKILKPNYRVKPKVIYGDSVTSDTPILLLNSKNKVEIKTIEEIGDFWEDYKQFKCDIQGLSEKQQDNKINYKVWTDKGWANIKRVIRHKTNKKIYEILTHTGCVRVTEDHSLLDINENQIKPEECKIGTKLLHAFPEIINNNVSEISKEKAYIYGFFFGDGSCGKYGEKNKVKYSWALNNKDIELNKLLLEKLHNIYPEDKFKMLDTINSSGVYKIVPSCGNIKKFVEEYRPLFYDKDKNKIIPNFILNGSFEEKESFLEGYYAADGCRKDTIKCNCHRFDTKSQISALNLYYLVKSLGFRASINKREDKPEIFRITYSKNKFRKSENAIKKIKNLGYIDDYVYDLETDVGHFHAGVGCMIVKNTDSVFFSPKIHDFKTKEIQTDKEALKMCIELGLLAGEAICKVLPEPEEQVYEKTLWPFIIITKKRYVGNLYETNPDKYYQKSMGIVLKRRDNAKIVKIIVGGIVNKILNERSNQGAIDFCKTELKKILRDKYPIDKFIISKTLKGTYKNRTRIVHAVLADRIGERDPGNKPDINDRIPWVYIVPKGKALLQGDRVEDPKYVVDNKLQIDYLFYITNQIMKPSLQFLELIAFNPNKIFDNYINKEINRRKNISSIFDYVTERKNNLNDVTDDTSDDDMSKDISDDENDENNKSKKSLTLEL